VCSAEKYVVPGMSEAVIDVFVQNSKDTDVTNDDALLIWSPDDAALSKEFVVASTLVDPSKSVTVKARVMNPNRKSIVINQDEVVAQAEPIESEIGILVEEENEGEESNSCFVRRIHASPAEYPTESVRVSNDVPKKMNPIPDGLTSLYFDSTDQCLDEDKHMIQNLLTDFEDIFSRDKYDLGLTTLAEHPIDTGDAKPIKQHPRRTPLKFAGEDLKSLVKLQKQGIIRPSTSPWASPIVLVRKKNGEVRHCVDYRMLNAVTKKDAFPIPRVSDCLDAVAGSCYFSTLDITSAYNQIPVKKGDIPKTAFVTKYGLYEYLTMPFGLCNASPTFQRVMEIALSGLQWSTCLIYQDDVIIHSKSFESHVQRLRQVFERIRSAGLKLSPEKCKLFKSEVTFLGHIVSRQGVLPNPDNVLKLVNWPIPRNVTHVRGIIGLGSYYRRFIKDFSSLMKPLIDLTKASTPFHWTDDCQKVLDTLKLKLTSPPIMAYPLEHGQFILDTDASDFAIGAVLSQVQDGVERPIAYGSRTLSKSEKNYCVTDKELLAVRYFIIYYKHYLLGAKFVVRSDHQALKWLFSLKDPKSRIARWIEDLSEFDFVIEYRPGLKHNNSDGMSRCPNPRDCQCPESDTSLQCGPCKKCNKRAVDMQSSWYPQYCTSRRARVQNYAWNMWLALLTYFSLIGEKLTSCFVGSSHCGDVPDSSTCQTVAESLKDHVDDIHDDGRLKPKLDEPLDDVYCQSVAEKMFNFMEDDGRLWPKLNIFMSLVTNLSRCIYLFPMLLNKVSHILVPVYKSVLQRCLPHVFTHVARSVTTRGKLPLSQKFSMSALRNKQLSDPDIGPILKWFESGSRPEGTEVCASSPATRHYWNYWHSLFLKEDVLFRKFMKRDCTDEYMQFIVPRCMKQDVLYQMHNALLSGHLGKKKTEQKVLHNFYWYGLKEDVKLWVTQCDVCAAVKAPPKHPKAPIGDMRVGAPMDRISMDILGPLPLTPRGNKYILVVFDYFTNWVEVFPVHDQTAITCANKIFDEIITRFGCPLEIHSDQGTNFQSLIFKELCQLLEVHKTRTSPRNPKCNGKVERFNRTLLRMIKSFIKDDQLDWDVHLSCLTSAYRSTPNETTGLSPNLLMLGREVRIPGEVFCGSNPTMSGEDISSYSKYVSLLKEKMQHAHDVARAHLSKSAERVKHRTDAKVSISDISVGDYVWYLTEVRSTDESSKLKPIYDGPFVVVRKMGDVDFKVQFDASGRCRVVHHDKLKPYCGTKILLWAKSAVSKYK